jgi:superoxide dismutase, Fe-Mn family
MTFDLPPLPWAPDALEPHISAATIKVHHGKHHRGYLTKLEKAIGQTPKARQDLETIVRTSSNGVFNNAAQAWNHAFYWKSLQPNSAPEPPRGELRAALETAFGTLEAFRTKLREAAVGHFGSGWAWLVADRGGRLQLCTTHDADTPIVHDKIPLLTIDVWEHAYYLDYQNEREKYVQAAVEHLLNWNFAAENLRSATVPPAERPAAPH